MARLLCCCLVWVALASRVAAGEVEVELGSVVKDLSFKDIRYLTRTLDDLPRSKAYVLVFVITTCPLVRRYLPVLNRLEKLYRDRGVQFVAVNAGGEDSIPVMAAQAVEYDVEFPFVKDYSGRCAAALGVTRTP